MDQKKDDKEIKIDNPFTQKDKGRDNVASIWHEAESMPPLKQSDGKDYVVHTETEGGSRFWSAIRHFLIGAILAGAAAIKTGNPLVIASTAIAGGLVEAGRKTYDDKRRHGGKADLITTVNNFLILLLELMKTWKERRGDGKRQG